MYVISMHFHALKPMASPQLLQNVRIYEEWGTIGQRVSFPFFANISRKMQVDVLAEPFFDSSLAEAREEPPFGSPAQIIVHRKTKIFVLTRAILEHSYFFCRDFFEGSKRREMWQKMKGAPLDRIV